jgi:hypothetical protein
MRHTRLLVLGLTLGVAVGQVSALQNEAAGSNDFVLREGRAGQLEIGMSIDEVLQRIGRGHVRLVDLSREGMFSPAIELDVPGASVAPAIIGEIREWPCPGFALWAIDVRDPKFRTVDNLGVGSTLGDLRRVHAIRLSHEEGEWAIVPELKMSFGLESGRGTDDVRVHKVWISPDPIGVRQRRCANR